MKTAIMDAAERRMQAGGFAGFSFRDIAADVGIKSASVHYHFPTKEDLAAAVVRRWSERLAALVAAPDGDPQRAWIKAFRAIAFSQEHMCPCTVLGAAAQDLPAPVAAEVKAFFAMCHHTLVAQGLTPTDATEFLATLTGALVVANVLGDPKAFDRATMRSRRRPT